MLPDMVLLVKIIITTTTTDKEETIMEEMTLTIRVPEEILIFPEVTSETTEVRPTPSTTLKTGLRIGKGRVGISDLEAEGTTMGTGITVISEDLVEDATTTSTLAHPLILGETLPQTTLEGSTLTFPSLGNTILTYSSGTGIIGTDHKEVQATRKTTHPISTGNMTIM